MTRKLVAVAFLIASFAVPGYAPSVGAAPNDLTAELVEFPTSLGPEGVLRIGLQLRNSSAATMANLRVSVAIHEGVETRSQLERTFRGRLGPLVGSDTIALEGTLGAGEQRLVSAEKPLSEMTFFRSSPQDRAYPVRITVRSGRTASEPVDTHMIFFSRPAPVPLGISLVLPMHTTSIYRNPARPEEASTASFIRSLSSGDIEKLLDAIQENPSAPVTIAPSGLFIDTLVDLADGFSRRRGSSLARVPADGEDAKVAAATIERLQQLVGAEHVQLMTMPYSNAFLPGLVRGGLADRAQRQVTAASAALAESLETEPMEEWLVAPQGGLDERTLSELQRSGVTQIITTEQTFRTNPRALTRGIPARIELRTGTPTAALVADRGLAARLETSEQVGTVQSRQRFLAETATIMLERPAQKRGVIALAPISGLNPALAEGLLGALGTSPWLRPTTPDQLIRDGLRPEQASLAASDEVLSAFPNVPASDYFSQLREARRSIDRYADLAPPEARLVQLDRRLLISESADWWTTKAGIDRGTRFAREVVGAVEDEMDKIKAPAAQTITLTSRNGVIPLSISSGLEYPVDVVVRLESDKLRFPDGEEIRIDQLRAPNRIVKIDTVARATGTFPLRVVVQTPNSRVAIAESRLVIRSTAYNVVAVAITAGAGMFLVGWWVVGSVRKRLPS